MRLKPKFRPNLAPVPRAPRARKISGSAAAGDAAAAARRIRYIWTQDHLGGHNSKFNIIFHLEDL